ncbi:MAG: hypothetical protein H6R46_1462, partial [Proteobacteria bacterium]|nr:hypothetical protein [Pseudomonadota bacterium]
MAEEGQMLPHCLPKGALFAEK